MFVIPSIINIRFGIKKEHAYPAKSTFHITLLEAGYEIMYIETNI